jgi:hypothetical protein
MDVTKDMVAKWHENLSTELMFDPTGTVRQIPSILRGLGAKFGREILRFDLMFR